MEQIRLVEELALNAWPARVVQHLDGWVLRWADGVTGRANSVWPNEVGALSARERLAVVEQFYRRFQAPARVQMTPAARPAELDRLLDEAGYGEPYNRSYVQAASLDQVIREAGDPGTGVQLFPSLTDDWFEAYCRATGTGGPSAAVRRAIHERIAPETAYALLQLEGQPASVGVGVVERGWVGVFSVATCPDFRRRRAAWSVMGALSRWAADLGARDMYLQVAGENVAARQLYGRLGFHEFYEYHYRQKPFPSGRQ
jgi:ribosomal protein S18 acetylase RimI-like enzyme